MRLVLTNKRGTFEIGGGNHPTARLLEIEGLSPPEKDLETEACEGGAGDYIKHMRDKSRTMTMSFDFYGVEDDVYKLYRILAQPLEMRFFIGSIRRKISAICINQTEIESIIYHRLQKIVLQFYCANPYFHSLAPKRYPVAKRTDLFPNVVLDDGKQGISLIVRNGIATVKETTTIVKNEGDTVVYPTIEVVNNSVQNTTSGISCSVVVKNVTTGKSMTISYNPAQGEKITFDAADRKITSNVNGNITGKITDDTFLSEMYLDFGDNEIEITATAGNTEYELASVCYVDNNYGAVMI